jgi:hypothetical protein
MTASSSCSTFDDFQVELLTSGDRITYRVEWGTNSNTYPGVVAIALDTCDCTTSACLDGCVVVVHEMYAPCELIICW